jgi:hypothetical protein
MLLALAIGWLGWRVTSDGAAQPAEFGAPKSSPVEWSHAPTATGVDPITAAPRVPARVDWRVRVYEGDGALRSATHRPGDLDGVLYARLATDGTERAARVLPVRGGIVALEELAADQLRPVAALLGGRPFVPLSGAADGAEENVLTVRPFTGHLLDVRDVDGTPASHLQVERSHQPGIENRVLHPGPSWAKHRLHRDSGSPLLVGLGDLETPMRSLYVRTPGSAWSNVAIQPDTAPCLDVRLAAGGSVAVDFGERATLASLALRVEREDSFPRTWRPLGARQLVLEGLPVGPLRLVLGAPNCAEHEALFVATTEVLSGEVTRVRLFEDDLVEPPTGTISVTLDLGVLQRSEVEALGRRLHVLCLHDTPHPDASLAHGMGELRRVIRERMHSSVPNRWSFQEGELPPGGYRLRLDPFGFEVEVWLEPGGNTEVELVLPDLARAEVEFRDADTGAVVAPRVTTVHQVVAAFGRIGVAPVLFEQAPSPEPVLRVRAVPGTVALTLHDETYGTVERELELNPGPSRTVVELRRATWIVLDAAGPDGPISPGDGWWEAIEFVHGARPAAVLTRAFPSELGAPVPVGGFRTLRVCIEGTDAVTLILPPHPEHGALAPVTVPAAEGSTPAERKVTLRLGGP